MRKKKQNSVKTNSKNGFENLIGVHTAALENNSDIIAKMLEALSKKKLSIRNREELKAIKRDLNRIDKDLDNLGDE